MMPAGASPSSTAPVSALGRSPGSEAASELKSAGRQMGTEHSNGGAEAMGEKDTGGKTAGVTSTSDTTAAGSASRRMWASSRSRYRMLMGTKMTPSLTQAR